MTTAENFFIVGIPSLDTRIDIYTMNTIADVAVSMRKNKILASSDKMGIFHARNVIKDKIKSALDSMGIEHGDVIRMLWLDTDIRVLSNSSEIAEEFMLADKNHWNLVGDYHALWTNQQIVSTFAKPNDKGHYTTLVDEELKNYRDYEPLPKGYIGGLGFYYGDFDLRHEFSMLNFGEDINFYRYMYEHYPGYELRISKTRLAHIKQMMI